jgi:beta-galactosidase/beta-glucuronidase
MKRFVAVLASLTFVIASHAQQWAPVGENIRTSWADEIDPANPLPEYPRPQMVRADWMNLNGLWNYSVTDASAETFTSEGKILVPFAIESSLSGVGKRVAKNEALWYEREFVVPRNWKGKNVILNFGAVDWHAEVYVNNVLVGEHKGGYDPFSFDITSALKKSGKQAVKVKVMDATDNSYQPRGKQCIISTGIWYTPVTGIWQTVWLEPVSPAYIRNYYVVSDIDKGEMAVEVDAQTAEGDVVKVAVLEGGVGYSAETPSATVIADAVVADGKAVVKIDNMKTWSPDSPYLYGVKVWIERKGKVVDAVNGYTAMRKISIKADSSLNKYNRMALNNELLFHFGPLDQGWWPDGLYTAPSDAALEFDVIKTKELGFNMIRKHIKLEPARWYYHCDKHGIMVWQDMPCIGDHSKKQMEARDADIVKAITNKWSHDSYFNATDADIPQEWKDNYYREWANIINAFKNFQCIVVWVPFNEAWGQFNTQEVVTATRELDDTRLINYASGGNFYRECDAEIFDLHHYPDPKMFLYDESKVNVLGEYGGIGWPVEGHLWQPDKNWGYVQYKSADEVLDTYEKYADMLIPLIDEGFAAAVYTQTTDVEIEVNGLMTYDRKVVKLNVERLSAINRKVIESL